MHRRTRTYQHLAGKTVPGTVRSRPSATRAIVQYGPDIAQAVVIDVPEFLDVHVRLQRPIVLEFDETGLLHDWRVAPHRP
jgi:hypothetical protein